MKNVIRPNKQVYKMRETYEECYRFHAKSHRASSFSALYSSRIFFVAPNPIVYFPFAHFTIAQNTRSLRFYATDFRMHTIDNGFTQKANPFFLFLLLLFVGFFCGNSHRYTFSDKDHRTILDIWYAVYMWRSGLIDDYFQPYLHTLKSITPHSIGSYLFIVCGIGKHRGCDQRILATLAGAVRTAGLDGFSARTANLCTECARIGGHHACLDQKPTIKRESKLAAICYKLPGRAKRKWWRICGTYL